MNYELKIDIDSDFDQIFKSSNQKSEIRNQK